MNLYSNLLSFFKFFKVSRGRHVQIHYSVSIRNRSIITIGNNVNICPNVVIWPDGFLQIKNNVGINPGVVIYGQVEIGNDVMIAPGVKIIGGTHNFKKKEIAMKNQGTSRVGVIIDNDVWIGANSVILDGVTVSEGCIIGAGSVVTSNTEPFSIYAGSPARLIKKR